VFGFEPAATLVGGIAFWLRASRILLPRPGGKKDGLRGIGPSLYLQIVIPSPDIFGA
jgi:hypothetical protein